VDLYFRLNVFPYPRAIPARAPRGHSGPRVNFLRKFCQRHGRNITGFTGRAIDAMLSYACLQHPGNGKHFERGVILARTAARSMSPVSRRSKVTLDRAAVRARITPALDDVFHFPDVARPCVTQHGVDGPAGEAGNVATMALAKLLRK